MKSNLNAKVGFDKTSLGHVMRKHGLGDRSDNGNRFADFCSFHRLVIAGKLFEHKGCYKIS